MGCDCQFRGQRSRSARGRHRRAVGRHCASGLVQKRSARVQLQGARWRHAARRHVGRGSDPGNGERENQTASARPAGEGAGRHRRDAASNHAAARKSAHQYLDRLRLCIGTARSRPLRDPRQLQLQADRNAAGLRRILAAADCSQEGWLCLRLSGVRASRTARPVAQLRTGDEPNSDGPQLMQPGGAYHRAIRLLSGRKSMRLVDYLDKGASLGSDAPCLTMDGKDLSYDDVQRLSYRIARGLANSGVTPGEKVAILSGNDPIAFACVFGISRAGAVWCPINPRNEAAENQFILDAFDCSLLLFHGGFAQMVDKLRPDLPKLRKLVCLDTDMSFAPSFERWLAGVDGQPFQRDPVDDLALIPGTGGTTGKPKGVMLSGRNIETMTALTLMSYPFKGRPSYLALAPLTHAAGVLCFPIMTLGGRVVIMHHPDTGEFLDLIARYRITHTFLPPTVIYMLLDHPKLESADLSSLQCFWYGAAPISVSRLTEALQKIAPMAQLFGQTEAPMMISMMPPGERGEIVVRGSLVMDGYYKNAEATAEASVHGWHHTGDIGYLDADNFLYIVDRAKDMIITGGFNVYSVEVENALQAHETIQDCAVIGLPDDKWGERVVAVVQPRAGRTVDVVAVSAFVKQRVGSVKTPKQIEVWDDLPRSKVGKVLKSEIRARMLANGKT